MGFNFHGNDFLDSKLSLVTIKICDFFFSLLACPPCRTCVREVKKKKMTCLESDESCQYLCPTRVKHRYVAKDFEHTDEDFCPPFFFPCYVCSLFLFSMFLPFFALFYSVLLQSFMSCLW